jgi:hypothetical protein
MERSDSFDGREQRRLSSTSCDDKEASDQTLHQGRSCGPTTTGCMLGYRSPEEAGPFTEDAGRWDHESGCFKEGNKQAEAERLNRPEPYAKAQYSSMAV